MKIKICGLFRNDDIDYVNAATPDYAGFVFAEASRRRVSFNAAISLRGRLRDGIAPVGVFVNAAVGDIERLYLCGAIALAQLHGDESEDYIKELKARCGISVIKAVRMESADDIKRAEMLSADFLLLDNGKGGTGQAFDWSLIGNVGKPYFLAGGIGLHNIADALKITPAPFALDISGGAETDGVKNAVKIAALTTAVHGFRKNRRDDEIIRPRVEETDI
ncbi:MAG: phosphoribosylanthranilate isomerase [Clostridiales bacterium]|jgi:phosphoribosylanthranilate isomerase|nr:phosphoribosylanthranilate isomerase [Clostridiales bacterium]